jgi:hypothetical protein
VTFEVEHRVLAGAGPMVRLRGRNGDLEISGAILPSEAVKLAKDLLAAAAKTQAMRARYMKGSGK